MDKAPVEQLYQSLIEAWNNQDAFAFASLVADDCIMIGFDGSQMLGKSEIYTQIAQIFKEHKTARYVTIIRNIRFLSDNFALLHSIVGMVPPGQEDIKPEVNAIQLLTAHQESDIWKIASFQNTPAAFHGRPELGDALTEELRNTLTPH